METSTQKDSSQEGKDPEREGIVVWDQKGLVVLWPDGHCSRFPWDALRQACACAECCAQRKEQQSVAEGLPVSREVFVVSSLARSVKGLHP
jgi:DUF971 family protein